VAKVLNMTKCYPPQELAPLLATLRQNGNDIVFTNGCFDLLHPGHIHTLTRAKALGDVLVVGINSDTSVKRLKGEHRPILSEHERALLLAALEVVDYVTVFIEDTPLELIRLLQPQVLVKGGDWNIEGVIGKEIVERNGGTVVVIPYQPGFSTTTIIQRILKAHLQSTDCEFMQNPQS
jgi:rfaE bifunctional protein nucleotidyltransferase chain/domain